MGPGPIAKIGSFRGQVYDLFMGFVCLFIFFKRNIFAFYFSHRGQRNVTIARTMLFALTVSVHQGEAERRSI